ncbi:MAG: protein kinase [Lachnospiraceae bacterium]|nr:protein kinase [Lachnospiraceae bacterium]
MDFTDRLRISYYKTVTAINDAHKIYLVKHIETGELFVKKILNVYNIDVYKKLFDKHIEGIPKIIDFCESDGQLIIIEEYISGNPLDKLIASGNLSSDNCLSYMRDLCSVLEKLHSFNPPMIHRDIKPSNVIITNYNRAVLLDFNATKFYSPDMSEDTVLLGTKGYAAPEQYGFGASSPQTDIYSLGMLFKEMLSVTDSHNKPYLEIANKCTRLDPKDRYENIDELKDALQSCDSASRRFPKNLRSFALPGYRTRKTPKIVLATITYTLVAFLSLCMEIEGATAPHKWAERICCFSILMFIILATFNYRNIWSFLPLCSSKKLPIKILGVILLNLTGLFVIFTFFFIIDSQIIPS